jgi:tetratricopeptide (TPR) repeat protein
MTVAQVASLATVNQPGTHLPLKNYENIDELAGDLYELCGIDLHNPAIHFAKHSHQKRVECAAIFPKVRQLGWKLFKKHQQDFSGKLLALYLLMAVLKSDPYLQASALDLLPFIKDVTASLADIENQTEVMRLEFIRLYSAAIDCFLMHSKKGHYGSIPHQTEFMHQDRVQIFDRLLRAKDKRADVRFAVANARAATEYIQTYAWVKEEILDHALDLFLIASSIGGTVATTGTTSTLSVSAIWNLVEPMIGNIQFKKEWYPWSHFLRNLTHVIIQKQNKEALLTFQKVVDAFCDKRSQPFSLKGCRPKIEWPFFYSAIQNLRFIALVFPEACNEVIFGSVGSLCQLLEFEDFPKSSKIRQGAAEALLDIWKTTRYVQIQEIIKSRAQREKNSRCIEFFQLILNEMVEPAKSPSPRVFAIEPDNGEVLLGYANALMIQSKFDEARKKFRDVLVIEPNNLVALSGHAETLRQLGQLDRAAQRFEQVLALVPRHTYALNGYFLALKSLGKSVEALKKYEEALALDPNDFEILVDYTDKLFELDRFEEAEKNYKKTLLANPGDATVLPNYVESLRKLGRLEEAQKTLEGFLTTDPKNITALSLYAHVLNLLRKHQDALKIYKRALAVDRKNPRNLSGYATTLLTMNTRLEEAEKFFKESLAIDPKNVFTLSRYGQTLHLLMRFPEAELNFKAALTQSPTDFYSLSRYAETLRSLGKLNEACLKSQQALARKPNDPFALRSYALTLYWQGKYSEALPFFEKSLSGTSRDKRIIGPYAISLMRVALLHKSV